MRMKIRLNIFFKALFISICWFKFLSVIASPLEFYKLSEPINVDTGRKALESQPLIENINTDSLVLKLFSENKIYNEFWRNDMTFVYDDFDPSELPETIEIPLLLENEKFILTWYGGLSSKYGPRWGRMHHGLDLHLKTGDTVVSAFDGIVRFADFNNSGYGNCVVVRHLNGLETLYGHLSQISVQANQFVKAGQLLGLGGSTGRSSGPHLHFETRYKDYSFDPLLIVDINTRGLKENTFVISKKKLLNKRYSTDKSLEKKKRKEKEIPSDTLVTSSDKHLNINSPLDSSNVSASGQILNKTDTATVTVNSQEKETKNKSTAQQKKAPEKNNKSQKQNKQDQPKKKSSPSIHIVKSGESLWTISRKYGMGWEKLAKINNLKSDSILRPGQKIKLK